MYLAAGGGLAADVQPLKGLPFSRSCRRCPVWARLRQSVLQTPLILLKWLCQKKTNQNTDFECVKTFSFRFVKFDCSFQFDLYFSAYECSLVFHGSFRKTLSSKAKQLI